MPSDDIVTRLRRFKRGPCIDAADEIERLRTQLEMWHDGNIMAESHRDEIVQLERTAEVTYENHRRIVAELTAERDAARREVCAMTAANQDRERKVPVRGLASGLMVVFFRPTDKLAIANERGWDCFKEER